MSDSAAIALDAGGAGSAAVARGRPMAAEYVAPLCAVAFLCAVDLVWNIRAGLTFTGWSTFAVGMAVLVAVGVFYSAVVSRPRVAEWAFYTALWNPCNVSGAIMSYLAATSAMPLMDDAFVRLDEAIGFDWVAWVGFVRGHAALNAVLRVAYDSLMVQLFGSIIVFSFARVAGRNQELMLVFCAAALLTCATAALLPALGPWVHFGQGALVPADTAYVPHTLSLRHDPAPTFALESLEGIVCFPSFHTTVAVLFAYAHRGIRWSFPPVAALNAVMLLSIPSEGGHYLVDMIAGAAVALAAIGLVRAGRHRREASSAAPRSAPRPACASSGG